MIGLIPEGWKMNIGVKTFFTLVVIIIGCTVYMTNQLNQIKQGIEEGKTLPESPVTRIEYDMKDQLVRQKIQELERRIELLENQQ